MTRSASSHLWSELAGAARHARTPFASASRNSASAFGANKAIPFETRDPPIDVAAIVARGHAKVIGHYRRLLRHPGLTAAERADIEARLAREEKACLDGGTNTFAA